MRTVNNYVPNYSKTNMTIWALMAFQAGVINIGGFLSCQRFVSHVTGFATFFGYEFTHEHILVAAEMLMVPLFFLLGTMLSAQLVDIRLRLHKKPRFYIPFGVIFMLNLTVFILGIRDNFGPFGQSMDLSLGFPLLALLCLTCGLQNGTTTSVSKSVIRTTHITGSTTDLGIGLIRMLNKRDLPDVAKGELAPTLARITLIFSFILGSLVGAFAFKDHGFAGFFLSVLTSGTLFAGSIFSKRFLVRDPEAA